MYVYMIYIYAYTYMYMYMYINTIKSFIRTQTTIGKSGVVKYIGKTEFSQDEPVVGVELDYWTANATDGSLFGKRYFDTLPGKGFFIRKTSFASLNEMIGDKEREHILRQNSLALENFELRALPVYFDVGDHVVTSEGQSGIVKFLGPANFSSGEMVGLALDEWDPNGHTGTVRNEKYFEAKEGHGWFVRADKITMKIENEQEWKIKKLEMERRKAKKKSRMKIELGQRVQISGGQRGSVLFYAKTDFGGNDKWVGLQLDDWYYNAHDGTVRGKSYFVTHKGYGYFVKPESVTITLRRAEEKKSVESLSTMPEINDRVRTIRGKTGVVRYVGKVDFAEGILIGVELDRWSPNGNDGSVKNHLYFECTPGRGYFTRLAHLVENLGSTLPTSLQKTSKKESEHTPRDPPPDFKLGDKVKLAHGKIGVVRFIGTTEDTGTDEIVGIELDGWDANANEGALGGKRLFAAEKGRGYFTRRRSIANIVRTHIREGAYAKLKGLVQSSKFNGKLVKIIEYVPKKQRWKVKLHGSGKKKDGKKKCLGVKEENLTPIFDWEVPPDAELDENRVTRMPWMGDHVRLKNGKTGVVRYLAPSGRASKEAKEDKMTIGLEMDEWHPSGHDGTVDNRKYFECKEGHGYFTNLDELAANLGQFDLNENKAPLPPKPNFKVGDEVRLARGKVGKVKFIGTTEFSNGEEIVGLELTQWTKGANDGSMNSKRYFYAKEGRGYFTRKTSVVNLVLPNETHTNESSRSRLRREINRTKRKLREIDVLEKRQEKGEKLRPPQLQKLENKPALLQKLNELENGDYDFEAQDREMQTQNLMRRSNLLERKATLDMTNLDKAQWLGQPLVDVQIDDAVRLKNGATGVVKWIGKVPILTDEVIGLVMDENNPNFHNGELDGKQYFKVANQRGYFALREEIQENLGTTKRARRRGSVNLDRTPQRRDSVHIGDTVNTIEGKGTVVWKGDVLRGEEDGKKDEMIGIELERFSANAKDGTIQGVEYFDSKQGRGFFAHKESVQLDFPPDFVRSGTTNIDFEIVPGDRVKTEHGYTGVEKDVLFIYFFFFFLYLYNIYIYVHIYLYMCILHFEEKEEMVGIELDHWSPNGNDGSVHGQRYFSCHENRGFFCTKAQIVESMGSSVSNNHRRGSRDLGKDEIKEEESDNEWTNKKNEQIKIGDRVELDRGRRGVIKWIGPTDFSSGEEMLGIELDEWWINGHDGSKNGKKILSGTLFY
ncbi:hypothetical protein RFI_06887, partial [Reticulomyxa filosa]